jgi:sulfatase maturation enzyme AslB (radical SAM superfamily)
MCDVGQQQKGTQFYQNMVASREEIPLGQLKKLIDEVKHFKPIIAITSTEPLLYHDLMDFVRYVVGSGLEIQITTNGYLLQEFAEEIVNLGVNVISVSIDGPSEVHNEIRGRNDSYERAIKGIQRITEHKKKTGKNFPEIRMNYSISNFNYKSLTDFFKGIKELEIESISVSHLNFVTNEMAREHNKEFGSGFPATPSSISSVNLAGIDIDDLYNQIREIKATCQRCTFTPELTRDQLKIFYREPEVFLKKHTCCRIPWNAAQIFANGDVGVSTRCFHIKFGNIYDEKFSNIWNGEKMRNFRNQLLRSGAFPACSRCCGVF